MANERFCTIFSWYKAHFGTSGRGNLLEAISHRNLTFNGTSENSRTVLYRKNDGKTARFYVSLDGKKYGICVSNGTIILKEYEATAFHVKQVPQLPRNNPFNLIKVHRKNLYLASDSIGKPVLCSKKNISQGTTGWFILKASNYDSVDGIDEMDNNNIADEVEHLSVV